MRTLWKISSQYKTKLIWTHDQDKRQCKSVKSLHYNKRSQKAMKIHAMSHTKGNKKKHLTILETCIFRVYLRNHLSYKKVVKIYLHSRLKSLQMKKRIFQIWSQNHLIFSKTLFCQKKVSYWKKSAILKNSKTFFHGSKV